MDVHVELAAETLFEIGPIPITNSMVTMFIVMGAILLVLGLIARGAQLVPGRAQAAFELIAEFLLNLVEATAGRRLGRRIFPLIGALFIFIIVANYSGLFPGVGTIGFWEEEEAEEADETLEEPSEEALAGAGIEVAALAQDAEGEGTPVEGEEGAAGTTEEHHEVLVPLFRAPNADLNMTLAMALLTFTMVQVLGIQANGFVGRIKHMADPWFMFPIELISELSRIVSLSFRLFGNVFAGEILIAVMIAMAEAIKFVLVPVLFPVIFLFLETLFGFIQALVFALLTLIYISLAAAGHGHDDHAHEGEGGHRAPAPGHGHATAGAGD